MDETNNPKHAHTLDADTLELTNEHTRREAQQETEREAERQEGKQDRGRYRKREMYCLTQTDTDGHGQRRSGGGQVGKAR